MKHDNEAIERELFTGVGSKKMMRLALRGYAEHQAAPLLEQLAAKDARIAELENALREMHDASYQLKVYAGRQNGKDVHYYVPHPLLKDQSSPLAEVAKKDADYL